MWEKPFLLLLLHSVEAVMASQCWQGATFSQAVVSPAVASSGILRIPGVSALPQCVAACCDLPGYDLAWLLEGRCYILSCQQVENCQPRERPGADSSLAFLRRAPPQTLVLQQLVRGEPYGGRQRPPARPSEGPGDLEALKDLALFDGPQRDFSDPGTLDLDYSQGSRGDETGRGWDGDTSALGSSPKGRDGSNQWEAGGGRERRPSERSAARIGASSPGNVSRGDEDGTRGTTSPPEETESKTQGGTVSPSTADSTHQELSRTTAPPPTAAHWPSSTTAQTGTDDIGTVDQWEEDF